MKMTGEEAHRLVMELLPKDRLVYLPESFANKIAKTILSACTAESEASAAELAAVTKEREKSVEFARNDEAAKWSPIVDALQQTAEKLAAQLASVTKERDGANRKLAVEHRGRRDTEEALKEACQREQAIAAAERERCAAICDAKASYAIDKAAGRDKLSGELLAQLAGIMKDTAERIRSLGPTLALDEMLAKARLEEAEIWHKEYVTNPDSYWTCQTPSERIAALRVRAKAKEVDRG